MKPLVDRRRYGRLLWRLGLCLAAASGAAASWPALTSAAATGPVATRVPIAASAWFWNRQLSGVGAPGAPPVELSDPTVPSGDVAVAGPDQSGQPQKETYLSFGLDAIPAGAQILSFTVTVPVDSAGTNLVPTGIAPPIIACLPSGSWAAGGPQPFSDKPSDQCTETAPKATTKNSGKSYSIDIASIAQQWLGASGLNVGVAITDDPANTSTAYQLAFGPASSLQKLQASVTYSPAAPAVSAPASPAPGGSATVTPAAPSSQGVSATAPASSNAQPTPVGSSGAATAAPVTAPVAQPGATAAPAPASAPASNQPSPRGSGGFLPAGFWIAGVALAALLILAGIVLSTPPEGHRRRRAGGLERLLASKGARLGDPPTGRVST